MEPPQRVRTCWLLWLPLDRCGLGVGVTLLALHTSTWMSVGNGETPSPAVGSCPWQSAERGCPPVSGLGWGCCAPAPAALTTSPAPSRPQTARSLKAGSPPALPESLLLTCIDVIASLGFPWKHWLARNSNTLIQAGGAGETVCNPAANSARDRARSSPHPSREQCRQRSRTILRTKESKL